MSSECASVGRVGYLIQYVCEGGFTRYARANGEAQPIGLSYFLWRLSFEITFSENNFAICSRREDGVGTVTSRIEIRKSI